MWHHDEHKIQIENCTHVPTMGELANGQTELCIIDGQTSWVFKRVNGTEARKGELGGQCSIGEVPAAFACGACQASDWPNLASSTPLGIRKLAAQRVNTSKSGESVQLTVYFDCLLPP